MPQVINTNVASLNSQRSLNASQTSLATSLQRLSSGLRINSAKDDAAGLAISARMSSQISGLNQASRNANDGISLAQTAEGGLQSITDSLQRMRELAVQASNATNTATDRAALQQEVDQLVQQINTVATQTAFNGVKLLDGTFNSQAFQIGANTGETISVNSIASAKADALGVGTTSSYLTTLTATVTNGAVSTGGITVNGYGVGPSVSDGVSSSAQVTGVVNTTQSAITAGDLLINGVSVGAVAAGANATAQGANLVTAINAQTATTGVVATNNAGVLTLTSHDGRDIKIDMSGTATLATTGLTAGTTSVGSDSAIAKAAAFNTVTGQTGVSAVATSTSVTSGALSANAAVAGDTTDYIKINGVKLGAIAAGTSADFTAQGNNVVAAINAVSNQTGVTAAFDSSSKKIALSAVDGRTITVETKGAAAATNTGFTANTTANTYGGIKLTSTSSAGINLGGANIATTALTAGYTAATATFGAGISSVNVSTATGAANAIATIDSALANINSSRANLGAVQNRFSSVVSNLATTSENLSASRSRILDADFAAETANLTRAQILQQAGTAMLAQANALPQNVLSLLRG
ncbi:flagellin [Accumulibacter sp.]|uniref:flagellin N-terminal helical domain-containing protein n=1 Tax=Accumulibacter sp. TaxID=2053492 RepID=UPI0025D7D247|nr:flagellin [Accumulibacter sp.]MCM8596751.1 flagellin [Accumulibacter sp.]MCM8624715.1 flagellin [Accumulibacter sp.]MDS4050900.1 flagellin [Accumulibacter sp.]